jgi:hypothetical protein
VNALARATSRITVRQRIGASLTPGPVFALLGPRDCHHPEERRCHPIRYWRPGTRAHGWLSTVEVAAPAALVGLGPELSLKGGGLAWGMPGAWTTGQQRTQAAPHGYLDAAIYLGKC